MIYKVFFFRWGVRGEKINIVVSSGGGGEGGGGEEELLPTTI